MAMVGLSFKRWPTLINQNKFVELSSPNVYNIVSFKHHLGGGYIDNILKLKSMNCYDYIFFLKFHEKIQSYCFYFQDVC
jgi:hypothetical protein